MDLTALRLEAAAGPTGPALLLRPWTATDAPALVETYRDAVLRRWTGGAVDDEASAAGWVREQERGRATGERFAFAVVERRPDGTEGALAGHVVLKRPVAGAPGAEVGYWTAGHARGRGVAPRALDALVDWAFAAFAEDGLTRLELLHQQDNTASCRVAEKTGFALTGLLPAAPPAFPLAGHLHTVVRAAQQEDREAARQEGRKADRRGDRET
ncbi:GNAT family N-acetyltransferase [Streptomyces adustus]|uniref:GNAT family N-acetyltransferase n=1 Tax=Streptomyces adustus TaxID=1609272 RepID=A0A5N8VHV5_9ACTN|nr:GNAT family N-acetyltransferase [Streptomyces adustus]MPY34753.1 GNAT family N-acetyltransferase [Streptomyces adustus]